MACQKYLSSDLTKTMRDMGIEVLFLLTGPPCGNNTKIHACIIGESFANYDEDMLKKMRDQIPHKYNCLGPILGRVIAKVGDEEMYYISPLSHDQQGACVRYMMAIGRARREAEIHGRREKVVSNFVRHFALQCEWEEPKQYPPTRMCDVD